MLSVEQNIAFQTAVSSQSPAITDLVTETFVAREPLCHFLGITGPAIRPLFEEMVGKSVSMGLCVVATDIAQNRIAGALIYQDYALPYVPLPESLCPAASPIFALSEELYRSNGPLTENSVELHLAATGSSYPSDRIATRLVLASRKVLREAGYSRIVCVLTNPASQRAFLRFAKKECSIKPSEFIWQGNKIFSGAKNNLPEDIILASRRIDDPVSALLTLRPVRASLGRRSLISRGLHRCFGSGL